MVNVPYRILTLAYSQVWRGLHCHSLLFSGITQNITAIEWCNHCSCSTRFIFPSVSNWRLCSNRLLFFFSAMWLWNVAHGYRVHWGKKNGYLQMQSSIRHPRRPAPRRPARLPGFPVLLAARWRYKCAPATVSRACPLSPSFFVSKYSLESSRRDLHNALLCTPLHRSLISKVSLKIAELFPVFFKNFANFAKFCWIFAICNQFFSGFFQNATFF